MGHLFEMLPSCSSRTSLNLLQAAAHHPWLDECHHRSAPSSWGRQQGGSQRVRSSIAMAAASALAAAYAHRHACPRAARDRAVGTAVARETWRLLLRALPPDVEEEAADGAREDSSKYVASLAGSNEWSEESAASDGDEEKPHEALKHLTAGEGFRSNPSESDALLPRPDEMVNPDVPSNYLQVYRQRPDNRLVGKPGKKSKGRSKKSRQKLEWRLKQGTPLAHTNWNSPSRLRVTTGIAKGRKLEQPPVRIRPMMNQVREAMFDQILGMHLFDDRSVRVLDLFSGTGSIGIEALSRGATECIFVDAAAECVDCAIANAWQCGFMERQEAVKGPLNQRLREETAPMMMVGGPRAQTQIQLHRSEVSKQPIGAVLGDVFDLLESPENYGLVDRTFNLVVAAPPYDEISYRQLCTALAKSDLIERDALVCIEYPRELGVLPPVLCSPFEDEEDADGVASGVPMLYGVRNREYGNSVLAIYSKLPTGARGRVGEPRPWEFTETLVPRKTRTRTRHLWQTPGLFKKEGFGEPSFAVPDKAPQLEK
mmetsp:Transcript_40805/g.93972  ORF Transcript_40805/g.93972 Transcript_40805/m.93972 type:complete len:541 (-) Transcript_40805:66-1688(-)